MDKQNGSNKKSKRVPAEIDFHSSVSEATKNYLWKLPEETEYQIAYTETLEDYSAKIHHFKLSRRDLTKLFNKKEIANETRKILADYAGFPEKLSALDTNDFGKNCLMCKFNTLKNSKPDCAYRNSKTIEVKLDALVLDPCIVYTAFIMAAYNQKELKDNSDI